MDNQEQVPANVEQPVEKTLTQSEVNVLVAREKQQAAAKARQEAMMEAQQQMQQGQQQQQAPQQQQQGQQQPYVSRETDSDAIYQQVQERFNQEMQQRQFQEQMTNIANSYHSKMESGSKSYQDFGDITKSFDPTAFPQLVYLLAGMENAADIVYEVSKNPSKLVTLDALAQRSPMMAQAELQKLSSSISQNKQASQEASENPVSAPLDHLQPSRVSGSNGKQTIRDLRNDPDYRG